MKNQHAEAFINKWWVTQTPLLSVDVEEWMTKTYEEESFWKEVVFAEQEQLLPKSPTIFGKSYNFYQDCILRFVQSNAIAYSICLEKGQMDHWTYERIHHCVNFHVEKWSYHSPQPGQLMAIVAAPGIHFLISMLTALRLGMKVCYLPTNTPFLGKQQLTKVLEQLQPALIAAEDSSYSFEGVPTITVNPKAIDEENHTPHSFAYPADTEMLVTLSLQEQEPFSLTSLDAHTTYLHFLRDGLFTFNLPLHPFWMEPLACPLKTEPFHTLTSLLFGINRLHVSDETIQKDPAVIQDTRVSLLGISSELQQLWTKVPAAPNRYLKSYYKSPFDLNFQSWKNFIQLNKLEKIPSFQVVMEGATGTCSLFSKPSLEIYQTYLKPTLGTSWRLNQPNGSNEVASNGFGIFTTHLFSNKKIRRSSNFTASFIENQLMITGFVQPSRHNITVPVSEIEENVRQLPFVEECCIYPMLKTGDAFTRHFVLLMFVSPMQQEISERDTRPWTAEIYQKLKDKVGSGYLPDQIEYFPLLPKMGLLGIDRAWCVQQYDSGLLTHKKSIPFYQTLTVLKKLVKQPSL